MGLFDFAKDVVKKVAGIADNPLSRAISKATGGAIGGTGLAAAQVLAGNKKALKATGAQSASSGASLAAGPIRVSLPFGATPDFLPSTVGSLPMPSAPGTGFVTSRAPTASDLDRAMGGALPGVRRGGRRLVPRFDRYSQSWVWVPAPRRMNYMNYRAAKRAARRLSGALKLLHKIESLAPRRRASGKVAFKKRRR